MRNEDSPFNTKQAADWLGVCEATLLRWRKAGVIKAVRIGERKYFYNRDALKALIETQSDRAGSS